MTDEVVKQLVRAAFEDTEGDQHIEQMLDAIDTNPITYSEAEGIVDRVIRAAEVDHALKRLVQSSAVRDMVAADEVLAAILDGIDAEPMKRADAEALVSTIFQEDPSAATRVRCNGHAAPTLHYAQFDWLEWFRSLDLLVKARIRLPDHTVVDQLWELGRILARPDCGAIIEKLGNAMLALTRTCREFIAPRRGRKIIVAHSELMHRIAIRIASRLENCHVCKVIGYGTPRVIASPKAIRGASVLLLFDIVDTGTLMRKVRERIETQLPRAIAAIAILNQGETKAGLTALCNTTSEIRKPAGTMYEYVYDDLEGKSRVHLVPDTLKDEKNAKEELGKCLDVMRRQGWLERLDQRGAIQFDRKLNNRKYTLFFDIPTVVTRFPDHVLEESLKALYELLKHGGNRVIVYPASRKKRVGPLVDLLRSRLGWLAAPLGSTKASRYVFDSNGHIAKLLRQCEGRALVVDCAIRTGETLQGLASEFKNLGALNIAAFYIMDALYDWARARFESDEGITVKSCFRLPLAMPSTNTIGPMWRASFEKVLKSLEGTRHLSSEAKDVIRGFCSAKLKVRGRTRPRTDQKLDTTIVEDASIRLQPHAELDKRLTGNEQGRGGIIKKLDINQVLRDPLIQYKLAGVVSNSAPSALKEWCVLALCTAKRFDLLAESCLAAPDSLFKAEAPEKWGIVPFVAFNAIESDPSAAEAMRLEVRRKIDMATSSMLFPEVDGRVAEEVNRCRIVEEILTPVGAAE